MVLSRITDRGVVLVAVQYRLGILGWLSHRGAAAEAGGASGNYGLMDQIAALKWVRANIASFGGDPGNVTIFGESAGSQDVSLLMAAPAARGLFHKAIMESGTPGFGMAFRTIDQALALGDQTGASIADLRARPLAEVMRLERKLADPDTPGTDFTWLRTTIDGAILPESPRALLEKAPPVPAIIGTNRVEFGPGPGEVDWGRELPLRFGAGAEKARAIYLGDKAEKDPRLAHPEMRYWTDWMFRCPAGELAELLAKRGADVYRYEFDVAENGALTAHAAEVAWIVNDKPFADGISLQDMWTRFAITGDPKIPHKLGWPRFEPVNRRHLLFRSEEVVMDDHLREPVCSMLETL